jgi:hypothetical protein
MLDSEEKPNQEVKRPVNRAQAPLPRADTPKPTQTQQHSFTFYEEFKLS